MIAIRFHRIMWLAAVMGVTLTAVAAAQRTVSGEVTDAENGQPLAGAVVKVGDDHHTAVTDLQGHYEIRGVAPGEWMVWAGALGYRMASGTIDVGDTSLAVDLLLDRDPIRLAAITATANRFESRRRASGQSTALIEESQIAGSGARDMLDFVDTNGGLHRTACPGSVERAGRLGCLMVRGQPARPVVYIDEVRWPDLELLSSYRTADVARVEVYGGGKEIRVYTRRFLRWAADHNYRPMPLP